MNTAPLRLPIELQRKVNLARNQSIVTPETVRLTLNCLDLTSLKDNELEGEIKALCMRAVNHGLASICVLPENVKQAHQHLKGTHIKIATVINFPHGDRRTNSDELATPETTAEDISRAVGNGANQIDIVQLRNYNRPMYALDIMNSARISCPNQFTLKSILETAAYTQVEDLINAARIALISGVDCLKTSTGVHENGGATLEAVAVLLDTIQKSGKSVGIKVSGGIKTAQDCAQYIALQRIFCGWNSIEPDRFRIGGSSLLDNLLLELNPERHQLPNVFTQSAVQQHYSII